MRNQGLEGKQRWQLLRAIKQSAEAPEQAERNYPCSLNQSSHLCSPLMSSFASRARSLRSTQLALTPWLQHTKMLWDTRDQQSLHICLAGYWAPITKSISCCFHTLESFSIRNLPLFCQGFSRAGSWSSQPAALLALAKDLQLYL